MSADLMASFPSSAVRWFPPAVSLGEDIHVPSGAFFDNISACRPSSSPAAAPARDRFSEILVDNRLTTKNAHPPQQLDEGAVALRLAGLYKNVDWSLYYYDGPETRPAFALNTSVSDLRPCPPSMLGKLCVRADTTLRPIFDRIRLAGGDGAYEFHGITARVEAAYGVDRLLPRRSTDLISPSNLQRVLKNQACGIFRDLGAKGRARVDLGDLFVARDTVEWGAGIDYRWQGWMPLLQVNQTLILDNPTVLLVNDVDTRLFFVVRKSFLGDQLATEVGIVQELERGYTISLSRFTYAITDNWRIRVGYLLIAGTNRSLVGQFHDNDEAFFQLRYSY